MNLSTSQRLALACGAIFSACQIAALAYFVVVVAPHMPPLDGPPAAHAAFYTEFARENLLSNFLVLLPMPLFAVFVAGLYHVLPRGVLATTALVTGATVAIAWPVGIVVATAGQGMAQHGLDPLTVITFDGVAQLMLAFASLPRAVFITAISLGVAKQSKGIAISGYALAVLSIPGSLALLQAETYAMTAIGTLLYFVWLAVLSGMLLRRPSIALRPQPEALLAAA